MNAVTGSPLLTRELVQRISKNPSFQKEPHIRALLSKVQQSYPTQFYKPYITCAASDKEEVITAQLAIINCLSAATTGYSTLLDNADLAVVALSSGTGKLGQLSLLVLMIAEMNKLRTDALPVSSLSIGVHCQKSP